MKSSDDVFEDFIRFLDDNRILDQFKEALMNYRHLTTYDYVFNYDSIMSAPSELAGSKKSYFGMIEYAFPWAAYHVDGFSWQGLSAKWKLHRAAIEVGGLRKKTAFRSIW